MKTLFALAALLLAGLCACTPEVPFSVACSRSTECPEGRTCVSGSCQPCSDCVADSGTVPDPADAAAPPDAAAQPDAAAAPDAAEAPDATIAPDAATPPDAGDLCAAVACLALDDCHLAGACDPATGLCSAPWKADGIGCDDGNPCTSTGTCLSGACSGALPLPDGTACADGDCHVGTCRPADWAVKLVPSGPASVVAGACTPITVVRANAAGQPAAPAQPATVTLGGAGSGGFFSQPDCSGARTATVAIPAGASAATVFLSNTVAESLVLTFDAPGLSPGSLALAVVAAAPHALLLSGPATADANACAPLTLRRTDVYANPAAPALPTTVTLGGQGRGRFSSSNLCDTTTATATIAAGASEATVYFASRFVEVLVLSASGLTVDGTPPLSILGPFARPATVPQATSGLPAGWDLSAMASADFDSDGNLDLAVTESNTNRLYVVWGTGTGSFGPSNPAISLPSGPLGVAAVSLRKDDRVDLVVANKGQAANTNNLSVVLGNGNRTFQAPAHYASSGTKAWAARVDVGLALVNASNVDVVLTYTGDSANGNAHSGVDVFPGNGDGTLGAPTGYAKDGIRLEGPAVGDVDGNGKLDFVVPVGSGNANAIWFRNDGTGAFTQELLNPGSGYYGTVWAFGDFNGDAFLDHIQALSWWGAFVDRGSGAAAISILMGDRSVDDVAYSRARTGVFRAEGTTDAVFAGTDGSNPRPGHNGILFYPCHGDGTCDPVVVYHLDATVGDFVSGDFDRDGLLDLVVLTKDGALHFLANAR